MAFLCYAIFVFPTGETETLFNMEQLGWEIMWSGFT